MIQPLPSLSRGAPAPLGTSTATRGAPAPLVQAGGLAVSPALPANTRQPRVLGRGAAVYGRTREVAALVLWTLALFFALALASYQGDPSSAVLAVPTPPGPDWVGPVGAFGA